MGTWIVTVSSRTQIDSSPLTPKDINVFEVTDEEVQGYQDLQNYGKTWNVYTNEPVYATYDVVYVGDKEGVADAYNEVYNNLIDED